MNSDPGQVVFACLVACLMALSPITLHVPEPLPHRTKRWKPYGHQ